jgi:hypothetical protein
MSTSFSDVKDLLEAQDIILLTLDYRKEVTMTHRYDFGHKKIGAVTDFGFGSMLCENDALRARFHLNSPYTFELYIII